MTRFQLILLATFGSAALLGGAFIFQALGYPPCELCLWQRWPHAAAILIGALTLALRLPGRVWPLLGGAAALATAAIGAYHSGVERHWWSGPARCTGSGDLGTDLLSTDGPRLVMCDQISWEMFGISMANYNVLFSLVLLGFWVLAMRRD
jgi:disulfide bond formation protein DsbB